MYLEKKNLSMYFQRILCYLLSKKEKYGDYKNLPLKYTIDDK